MINYLEIVLQILQTCLSVSNNFCGKLALSKELPITFDDNVKVIPVYCFSDFHLLNCE